MFTICVLPILLYPLTGLMMLQLAQVKTPQRLHVAVVGDSAWLRELKSNNSSQSSDSKRDSSSIEWAHHDRDSSLASELEEELIGNSVFSDGVPSDPRNPMVQELLTRYQADAILIAMEPSFPDGMSAEGATKKLPQLIVLSNQRLERSRMAVLQLQSLIERWHHRSVQSQLEKQSIAPEIWQPPPIAHLDSAPGEIKQAVVWSKILPLIMLVWALTGAFYPAIDLCAGEKERGTLETLLSSPASRKEIVWGKLLTVMCFSIMTAILNLLSMVVTTTFVFRRALDASPDNPLGGFGNISIDVMLWLVLLVIPMSAMFSAIALAVASLARSTKEGQYYLMPLILVGFPLVILPMLPGITLSSGTSIVPVTGAVLIARALMDGEYVTAMMYLPSVACVTVLCCLLATRWAVRQFENESVLFADVEKVSFKGWLFRYWMHRRDYPSATGSVLCGLSILIALFFGRLAMGSRDINWVSFATSTFLIQIGLMLGPTLIMAVMLTRSLRQSLRLNPPRFSEFIACGLLAVYLHPTYVQFAALVSAQYPLGPETTESLLQIDSVLRSVPLWSVLLVMAILPALCEEIVFRGFVFAGLLQNKGVLRAVIGSAVLFGLSHGVLQQTVCATATGLLLGWLAYRTAGVACTCLFHIVHNSISMTMAAFPANASELPEWLQWAIAHHEGGLAYTDTWQRVSLILALVIIAAFARRDSSRWMSLSSSLTENGLDQDRSDLALSPRG